MTEGTCHRPYNAGTVEFYEILLSCEDEVDPESWQMYVTTLNASVGGEVLIVDTSVREQYQLQPLLDLYSDCGTVDFLELHQWLNPAESDNPAQFTCTSLVRECATATAAVWVFDAPSGVVGDCVVFGHDPDGLIAGEYADLLGSVVPPGGLAACRRFVAEVNWPPSPCG